MIKITELFRQQEDDEHYGLVATTLQYGDNPLSIMIELYSDDERHSESEDVGAIDLSAEQFEAIAAAYFAAKKG